MAANINSPFLRLPAEIRLEIYRHLLTPVPSTSLPTKDHLIAGNTHYDLIKGSLSPEESSKILTIRILDPQKASQWAQSTLPKQRRTKCLIRTDRFRARTMESSYTATNNPGIEPAILATCRQVHAEAAPILYAGYTFDFDTHIEAIPAFLGDLTPLARGFVRSVGLVKRATPYDRDFDRCEWKAGCLALSTLPSLRSVELGVVAGRPGPSGWDVVPEWRASDFEAMVRWRNWEGLEWVKEFSMVKLRGAGCGLRKDGEGLKVKALVEHCPPPGSEGMAFWVSVSRNVEGGFAEWVKGLVGAA